MVKATRNPDPEVQDNVDLEAYCDLTADEMVQLLWKQMKDYQAEVRDHIEGIAAEVRGGTLDEVEKVADRLDSAAFYQGPGWGAVCTYRSPKGKYCGFHDHRGEMVDGRWLCRMHRQFPRKPYSQQITEGLLHINGAGPDQVRLKLIVEFPPNQRENNDYFESAVFDGLDTLLGHLHDYKIMFGEAYLSETSYSKDGTLLDVTRITRESCRLDELTNGDYGPGRFPGKGML